jgi:hypothetical protein
VGSFCAGGRKCGLLLRGVAPCCARAEECSATEDTEDTERKAEWKRRRCRGGKDVGVVGCAGKKFARGGVARRCWCKWWWD